MDGVNTPAELEAPKSGRILTNAEMLTGKRIPASQAIKTFSPGEFEDFIHEWAYGHLKEKGRYLSVQKIGGSGDKGRDVIAYADAERKIVDYYQCKHYDKALSPANVWVEIGKLCYFTYIGDILFPRKYYFVAPRDVNTNLATLLHDPNLLRTELIRNWKKCCEKNISKSSMIPLANGLEVYVSKMDFSVFDTKAILEIISEHAQTPWFAARFGGGLRPRPKAEDAPDTIGDSENRYVEQLMEAYSDKTKTNIVSSTLSSHPAEAEHFKRQRNSFYSAEALRMYARESLPPEYDEFEKLKIDIHDGVINTANRDHTNGVEKVDEVVDVAMKLPIEGNLLASQLRPRDKHGICHHLANEDKLTWVPKLKHE